MTVGGLQTALVVLLALLLLTAAITDLRSRTISNLITGCVALLAPLFWWASGYAPWPDMVIQLCLGAGMFALFALVFMAGAMGGGDVKLLAALALWLPLPAGFGSQRPFHDIMSMLLIMSILGGVLTVAMLAAHKLRRSETKPEIPYGVAIAAAGLWAIGEPYLNHFG